jgi:hypothetical protein
MSTFFIYNRNGDYLHKNLIKFGYKQDMKMKMMKPCKTSLIKAPTKEEMEIQKERT